MNQVNAIVKLNVRQLNRPLITWHARQLHSFVAQIDDIPDDVTSIIARVFKTDGVSHFDIPINRRAGNSIGLAYVIGTCFLNSGEAKYEIHAYDANGNMTALGVGLIQVDPFTGTGAPIQPGQSVPVMQITDKTGALHTILAVGDGQGNFTTILDDTEAE